MQKAIHQSVGLKFFLSTAIATVSFSLPALAQSQPKLIAQAQSLCRLVKQDSNVYYERNTAPQFVVVRESKLRGTEVELVKIPDPSSQFAQIQLDPPRYIESRNLQLCGTALPNPTPTPTPTPTPGKPNSCRMVNGTLAGPIKVRSNHNTSSAILTEVNPKQKVYVMRYPGGGTVIVEEGGLRWVQLDLQQSFGRNFGLKPAVGWMFNSEIGKSFSNLVNCS